MTQDVLELINQILEPKRLSYLQEIVFLQSWSGKPYREIAIEAGYDFDYVKEVGAQVWQSLSEALGEKVTKKNVKLILASRYDIGIQSPTGKVVTASPPVPSELLEVPSDSVPLYSNLYIERPPIEERVYTELSRAGSLIRIKAPRQMGKTSLVLRALAHARNLGFRTVMLNFQQADNQIFTDLRRFLRWFCVYVSRQVNLEPKLGEYWDDEMGSKVSCTIYFQEYLLNQLNSPLVLALDEVNRIFEYPELAQEFLPLLRTWHEAAEQEIWQRLRLVIVHSTEIYIPLKLSQSPFNVGLPIQLPEFTRSQVEDLANRYELGNSTIPTPQMDALMNLVGGHPYLIRLAFHWLKQHNLAIAQLLQEAPTQAGIYSNHLRHLWSVLQEQPKLLEAFRRVVESSGESVQLEAIAAYQLESMGLVKLRGNAAVASCELYRLYFGAQLREG